MMQRLIIILFILFSSCSNSIREGNYYEKIDKYNIEYTIKGKGPVLIVGHPTSGKIAYESSLQPLEKYFTVVYYNSRGIGRSETPKSYEEYQDSHLVKEIDELRKKLNIDQIWLFGHSDQSAIALQYAVDYPEHLDGLILSGTGFINNFDEMMNDRNIFETKRKNTEKWFKQVVDDWDYMLKNNTKTDASGRDLSYSSIKWWCYNQETFEKVKPYYDSIQKIGKRKEIPNQINPYTTEQNIDKYLIYQEKFNQITIPILIINGKFDTNNPPKKVEKLHEYLQNSDLFLIDHAGHFPWIEQKNETFQIIKNWLNINLNR